MLSEQPGTSYEKPLVSIVMPAFNAEAFLEEAISSIRAQSFQRWELVAVDDASSDRTLEILKSFARRDSRCRYERLTVNQGAAAARNRALEISRGRFIAFLDSDDRWLPGKLERQITFMMESGSGFSFTGFEIISSNGVRLALAPPVPESMSYEDLLRRTLIGCSTVVIDRGLLGDFKFPLMRTRQDLALWLSLLRDGYVANGIPDVLTQYRMSPDGISKNKLKAARQVWRVYREHEKLGLFKAGWCFMSYAWHASVKHSRYR